MLFGCQKDEDPLVLIKQHKQHTRQSFVSQGITFVAPRPAAPPKQEQSYFYRREYHTSTPTEPAPVENSLQDSYPTSPRFVNNSESITTPDASHIENEAGVLRGEFVPQNRQRHE